MYKYLKRGLDFILSKLIGLMGITGMAHSMERNNTSFFITNNIKGVVI